MKKFMLSNRIFVLILVGLLSINLSYGMDAFGLRSSCVTKIHTDNNPWLCFVANSTNSSVALNKVGESAYYKLPVITLEYSRDGLLWNEYAWTGSAGNVIVLSNKGDRVYFKAGSGGNAAFSRSQQMRYCFSLTGSVAAKGNIQSILDATMQQTSVPGNAFAGLFRECECLTSAPRMPAMTLSPNCYSQMFFWCGSLEKPPVLPATNMADYCYSEMFYRSGIKKAPRLDAMSLAPFCYYSMFERCYNLEEAPELPAKVLSRYCYAAMFLDCNSLYKAPELPASTLDTNCYNAMFRDSYSVYLVYMSGITEAEYDASLYGDI